MLSDMAAAMHVFLAKSDNKGVLCPFDIHSWWTLGGFEPHIYRMRTDCTPVVLQAHIVNRKELNLDRLLSSCSTLSYVSHRGYQL